MPTTKLNNGQLPTTLSSKTIDNTNDINTTTTKLKISGGTNGQVLSTDGSGNLSWTTAGGGGLGAPTYEVVKTADESVIFSTLLQDDDHLFYTLSANKTYYFAFHCVWQKTAGQQNQIKFAVDGGSNGYFQSYRGFPFLTDGTAVVSEGQQAQGGVPYYMQLYGSVKITSGITLKLRWAQLSSSPNASTLFAGSRLQIWEY